MYIYINEHNVISIRMSLSNARVHTHIHRDTKTHPSRHTQTHARTDTHLGDGLVFIEKPRQGGRPDFGTTLNLAPRAALQYCIRQYPTECWNYFDHFLNSTHLISALHCTEYAFVVSGRCLLWVGLASDNSLSCDRCEILGQATCSASPCREPSLIRNTSLLGP